MSYLDPTSCREKTIGVPGAVDVEADQMMTGLPVTLGLTSTWAQRDPPGHWGVSSAFPAQRTVTPKFATALAAAIKTPAMGVRKPRPYRTCSMNRHSTTYRLAIQHLCRLIRSMARRCV